jgi:hypothetical protein
VRGSREERRGAGTSEAVFVVNGRAVWGGRRALCKAK